eukprot:TRINITY_DN14257_c0_g1_i2.p1 TRINITY_DN14257_c0_g1~~TRINITY_DN14257_c0_g1_i2.p1  ORF type:complete len:298 (-),score=60.83 TRINITY_DN14257_c0_g1_i2:23-847(-)
MCIRDRFYNPNEDAILDLKASKNEALLLTEKFNVTQLSLSTDDERKRFDYASINPALVPGQKIIKISCGQNFSVAITNKGVAYSWGSSAKGRLGQGRSSDIPHPQIMYHLLSFHIFDISCGMAHSVALGLEKRTSNFQENQNKMVLFVWGSGEHGCLGLGSADDMYLPTRNDAFSNYNIKEAYCGYNYTCIITFEGEIYCCGSNKSGQLGSKFPGNIYEPKRIDLPLKNESILPKSDDSSSNNNNIKDGNENSCLLYTSPSPRDGLLSRMPSSA